MEAVRAALFGFLDRRSRSRNRFEHPDGGSRKVVLELDVGSTAAWRLVRTEGQAGLSIVDDSHARVPESELRQRLQHADRSLYEGLFAFSLGELVSLEALDTSAVQDRLLGAALGAGSVSPGAALKELIRRRDALYRYRGSKNVVARARAEVDAHKQRLNALRQRPHDYERLVEDVARARAECDELTHQRQEQETRLHAAKRLLSVQARWEELVRALVEAEGLAHASRMPADARARLATASEERTRAERRVVECREEFGGLEREIASLVVSDSLEPFLAELETYASERSAQQSFPRGIQSARDKLEAAERIEGKCRSRCGEYWTPERVRALRPVLELKRDAHAWTEKGDAARRATEGATTRLRSAEEERQEVVRERERAAQRHEALAHLDSIPPEASTEIAALRGQAQEIGATVRRHQEEATRARERAAAVEVDDAALGLAEAAESARARVAANRDLPERLERARRALHEAEQAATTALAACGSGWDEGALASVAHKRGLDAELSGWASRLAAAKAEAGTAASAAGGERQRHAAATETLAGLLRAGPSRWASVDSADAHRLHLAQLEVALGELRTLAGRRRDAEGQQAAAEQLVEEREREVQHQVPDLGLGWTTEQVLETSVSRGMTQHVARCADRISAAERERERLTADLAARGERLASLQSEAEGHGGPLPRGERRAARPDGQAMGSLRSWLNVEARAVAAEEHAGAAVEALEDFKEASAQAGRTGAMPAWIVWALLVLCGAGAGLLVARGDVPAAAILGGIGLAVVLLVATARRRLRRDAAERAARGQARLDRLQRDLDRRRSAADEAAAELGRLSERLPEGTEPRRQAVRERLSDLEKAADGAQALDERLARRQSLESRISAEEREIERTRRELERQESDEKRAREEWSHWADEQGLGQLEGPADATSLLMEVKEAQVTIRAAERAREQQRQVEGRIGEVDEAAQRLLADHQADDARPTDDLDTVVAAWRRELADGERLVQQREKVDVLAQDLAAQEEREASSAVTLKRLKAEWEDWLEETGWPVLDDPGAAHAALGAALRAHHVLAERNRTRDAHDDLQKSWCGLRSEVIDETELQLDADGSFVELVKAVEQLCTRSDLALARRAEQKREQRRAREHDLRAAEEQKREELAETALAEQLAEYGHDSVETFLAEQAQRDELQALQKELSRCQRRLEDADARIVRRRRRLEKRADELAHVEEGFSRWLAGEALPLDLESHQLTELLDQLAEYGKALDGVDEARLQMEKLGDRWAKMLARYRPLLEAAGLEVGLDSGDHGEVVARIRRAVDELAELRDRRRSRQELERRRVRACGDLERAEQELEERGAAVDALLERSGAGNEDEYTRWSEDSERLGELRAKAQRGQAALVAALDPEADWPTLQTRLRGTAWDEETVGRRALEEKLKETEGRLSEVEQRIGSMERGLAEHEQTEESGRCRQSLATAEARLVDAAEQWLDRCAAVKLVELARDRFERERQPKVLATASDYFSLLTGGAYSGVRVRLGEREMHALRSDGALVPLLHLSRGTVEPLYLALRLALIDDFAKGPAGAPPVLMDDILVNFDGSRQMDAVRALAQLGESTQVVLLTCHERTVERFAEVGVDHRVLRMATPAA